MGLDAAAALRSAEMGDGVPRGSRGTLWEVRSRHGAAIPRAPA